MAWWPQRKARTDDPAHVFNQRMAGSDDCGIGTFAEQAINMGFTVCRKGYFPSRDRRARGAVSGLTNKTRSQNERRVRRMTEITRKIVSPTTASANWRCSDCAWSQPFARRLEVISNVPSKAIEDAFNRHKCTEHRPPKWGRQSL